MHLTVRFLGDVDEALVPRLQESARALGAGRDEVTVRARALGAFPRDREARVLVLPIEEPSGVLEAIAKGAETAAVDAGLAPEPRPFRAHLTLARLRHRADLRRLVTETAVDLEGRVTSLALYRSELGKAPGGGPMYTALERVGFRPRRAPG